MTRKKIESPVDIPLSCSLFLEPALGHFKPFVAKTSQKTKDFVHQWNCALVDVIKNKHDILGDTGQRIVRGMETWPGFLNKCVSAPLSCDMPSWSLHYAIRFTESLRFLKQKQQNANNNIMFADYGCGLSPVSIIAKNEYDISNAFCIELSPQIIDVYGAAADKMGVKAPQFIEWKNVVNLTQNNQLNTIIGMGVFPYMSVEEQLKQFRTIYKHIPNFLIEVKYNPNPTEKVKNSFTLDNLRTIRLTIENVDSLETTVMRNSVRYLSVFRKTLPNERKFIENSRSLFLSR